MLKREKEVFGFLLDTEEAVMKELEEQYRKALEDINTCIMVMQADELTQSKVYRIEYQKTLKKQVEAILEKLHSDEFTTMQQYLSGTYTDAYVGTVYALHGQGVPVLMPIDQKAAVKAVLTDSKINTDLYTHLGVDITKLKKAIRNEITRGIASGMLYQDIARNVSFTTGTPLNRAKNIVQTEGHRIQQASAHDARHHAISRGADLVKQWDATLDGATRDTHRKLDGQIREVDEPFEMDGKEAQYPGDFGDPAEDCRCRCVALSRARSALDEAELETMKERAKFFGLDKTKEFEDFEKKYLKAAEEIKQAENQRSPATNKFGQVIVFDKKLESEKWSQSVSIIKQLADEYDTRLTTVGVGSVKAAGSVGMGGDMLLSSSKPDVAIHEFAHTIAMESLTKYNVEDHAEFWKEIKAVKRAYIKDVGRDSTRWISSYEYTSREIDEFLAEAFTQAKMHEMGLDVPDKYGKDLTYSKKVLDIVNKHFGKERARGKTTQPLEKPGKSGIIKVANSTLSNGLPMDGKPDSIVDKTDDEGRTLQRRLYNSQGMAQVDFDTSDHNRPDVHTTGAHKHIFDYSSKKPRRGKPEKLSEEELEQNSDIIKRGDNYHDEE